MIAQLRWVSGQVCAGRRQNIAGYSRAGQGRAGQGRAGQGRAGQGRAGQGRADLDVSLHSVARHKEMFTTVLLAGERGSRRVYASGIT